MIVLLCTIVFQGSAQDIPYYGNTSDIYFGQRLEKFLRMEDTKVIDHAVYHYRKAQGDESACYWVVSYFDSEEAMNSATEIRLKDEIEGVPVSSVQLGYDPDEDVFTEPYWHYAPPVAESVTDITFPKDLKVLGAYAFSCLPHLKNYVIPQSTQTIGRAFYRQLNLTEITIPNHVKQIGENAFEACGNLQRVVFQGNTETIGKNAFIDCSRLQSIKLPKSIRSIGAFAFSGCTRLTKIAVPDAVRSIGRWAFFDCPLNSITIPAGCSVKKDPFGIHPLVKKVVFGDQTDAFVLKKDLLSDSETLTTIVLPRSAKTIQIQELACINCTALKKIINAENITEIGKKAFKGCTSLDKFTLPAKIKSVGAGAFAGTGLKKLIVSGTKKAFLSENGNAFLKTIPANCKIYVKNNKMKNAFVDAGWQGRVIVK